MLGCTSTRHMIGRRTCGESHHPACSIKVRMMPKEMEEFYFAIGEGDRRYSEVIIVKVRGSDLYVFNAMYRGIYHVSLHADGRAHVKREGEDSLRHIGQEETVKPGKAFEFRRPEIPNAWVNPLNILIGNTRPWVPLTGIPDIPYERIPVPSPGKVARVSVCFSNTDSLPLFQSTLKSNQTLMKAFSVHNGSFHALLHEEIDDPGVLQYCQSSPEKLTPTSAPVDRDWNGDEYSVRFLPPNPDIPHSSALMFLVHNVPR